MYVKCLSLCLNNSNQFYRTRPSYIFIKATNATLFYVADNKIYIQHNKKNKVKQLPILLCLNQKVDIKL